MLTDTMLRGLKPQAKRYKVADRDGMYVLVLPTGGISFRYDYRLNGRRETFVIGRYSPRGLTLALAREKCLEARNAVLRGESPAQVKQSEKHRLKAAKTFCDYAEEWFREADLADSTKAMRRGVYNRDIYPRFKRRVMTEITEDDVRSLCEGHGSPCAGRDQSGVRVRGPQGGQDPKPGRKHCPEGDHHDQSA